jgi:hypothetical protein
LLVLEPGVDTAVRQAQIAALVQRAVEAEEVEAHRRKLVTPALFVIMTAAGLFTAGALLYGMKPREILQPTAYRQERRDRAGIVLMVAGAAVMPAAITLGVLAGRQARRDEAVRDLEVQTGRVRASLGVSPQLVRGGGGLGLTLRF